MKEITPDNALSRVSKLLDKLPDKYVVCIDCRRSKGKADLNRGQTKFELIVRVYDSELHNWKHQPPVLHISLKDSVNLGQDYERLKYLVKSLLSSNTP